MSTQIPTNFAEQFGSNAIILAQQRGSKLMGLVQNESIVGEKAFTDQIGNTSAQELLTRHSDTPVVDTPHERRQLTMRHFVWADLIDEQDRIRTIPQFDGPYSTNAGYAMGRKMDDVILEAIGATANIGRSGGSTVALSSFTGQDGSTANHVIDQAFATTTTLTIEKLLRARLLLETQDALDDEQMPILVAHPRQKEDLLAIEATTISSDFNAIKPLVNAEIDTWAGFRWVFTTRAPTQSEGFRRCFAYHPNGVKLGIGSNITARVSERPDKNHSTQVFLKMDIGATRLEERRVVEIECQET